MSQNNSKSRKSKFSNSSSSGPEPSSNSYAPSFKPQAPPSQAPHYYNKPGYPQNPGAPSYPESHSYSKSSYDKAPPVEMHNMPNYGMNYMAFYPPQSGQNMAPPPRNSGSMEIQQQQYGNYYNPNQGYIFGPGYQSGFVEQGFSQQDLNNNMMGVQGMGQVYAQQDDKSGQRQRMEVTESYENYGDNDNNMNPKRMKKEGDERSSEFDLVQKKTKTENLYQQRLEILANELAKIKESEVEIIQNLFNSPLPNISNLKARKELENLLMQKGVISQTPLLPSNLIIQAALVSLPHEALRNMFASLVNGKVKEPAELEQMKKEHINIVRKEEEESKNGQGMDQEGETPCKVLHVSTQQFYQSEPAIKELEDKLERMEHMLREKRAKVREATRKVGETCLAVEFSKAKHEIATRRLEDIGLMNKEEGK